MPSPSQTVPPLREVSPAEAVEDFEGFSPQFARAGAIAAVSSRTVATADASIRSQVELLALMRRTRPTSVSADERLALHLVWRLMIAASLAVATLTIGVVLTAIALFGGSFSPSPLIALSVFFAGAALTATLASVLRVR